ncbi:MAG: hydrogenase formation protein HypD [Thermoanaerobacteraceae bacterium]|nr:hydrogenase formation protein HypD [Thermoanaerobacteraceae bacterium]
MRPGTDAAQLVARVEKLARRLPAGKTVHIMEVCGTHTHAIGKSGLRQLLPGNIRLISGPGCPVCVTHDREIAAYLDLAERDNVVIATFGDLLRVPGVRGSLAEARSRGAAVKVVYSPLEALQLAEQYWDREIVFLAVGFETTAPTVGMTVKKAKEKGLGNFSVLSMHKLVPPVLEALLLDDQVRLDGFILPGHVCTITGVVPFQFLPRRFEKGGVITGFEPCDILQAVAMLLAQIIEGRPAVEIQYRPGVRPEGNPLARQVMQEVFVPQEARWRGLGQIAASGLALREQFRAYDAAFRFSLREPAGPVLEKKPGCSCGDILKGIRIPPQCPLFKTACTPANPAGPCMVSSEGTCAAYYRYEQYRGG